MNRSSTIPNLPDFRSRFSTQPENQQVENELTPNDEFPSKPKYIPAYKSANYNYLPRLKPYS